MGFSRQEYWRGLPCPPPGDLPNPGMESASLMSYVSCICRWFFTLGPPWRLWSYPFAWREATVRQLSNHQFLCCVLAKALLPPGWVASAAEQAKLCLALSLVLILKRCLPFSQDEYWIQRILPWMLSKEHLPYPGAAWQIEASHWSPLRNQSLVQMGVQRGQRTRPVSQPSQGTTSLEEASLSASLPGQLPVGQLQP